MIWGKPPCAFWHEILHFLFRFFGGNFHFLLLSHGTRTWQETQGGKPQEKDDAKKPKNKHLQATNFLWLKVS